jgi:hypothetical protein
MTARKLDQSQWRTFFDHLSKTLEGKQAEIEVASLSLGDQVEAEWLPLHGMTPEADEPPSLSRVWLFTISVGLLGLIIDRVRP